MSPYRIHKIMLLARLNLGLASKDKNEIDLYNYYNQNTYSKNNQNQSE